jgi:uncharacterized protein (TIGR02680 family)
MSRWKMNRAGFINFWYYDNEIFNFEDGRLLLRGSNGSGKSVTMQSLIPLLLDGDKRPERLDPFGSRARKIDNYLLDENSDEDERTGYIFLEFKKDDSDTFMTIGLGIRAKKNTSTSSWGFCIVDGRRIGLDFNLTKVTTGEIPLSKKELENRLGTGGFVTDKMQEYMHKVNDLLFGYSDVDDYGELIKLLIQLRSPKLSKDFKPTVLYEIMTNSLQTLTDEDLRPMSEAIESMDITKNRLENLLESKKSLNKIKYVYDRYNQLLMYEKINILLGIDKEYSEAEKEEIIKRKEISENELQIITLKEKLENSYIEETFYKNKKESLQDKDEFKLLEKLSQFGKDLEDSKEKLNKKNIQLELKKQKEVEINKNIKETIDDCGKKIKSMSELLEDVNTLSESIGFDEHAFMNDEFSKNMGSEYDFSFLQKSFDVYKTSIESALELLKEKEFILTDYDNKEKQADLKTKIKDDFQKEVKNAEEIFIEIKEELIENINRYNKNNLYFKIDKDRIERIIDTIYNYSTDDYFDNIRKIFNDALNEMLNDVKLEIRIKESQLSEKLNEIDDKNNEIDEWKAKKDPEPERKQEVIQNRIGLAELNIPFVPLYKAIDFNDDTDEKIRATVEESFLEMGLLDALVIPEKYKNAVFQINGNVCDKYIFSDPNYLSYELSQIMHADKSCNEISSALDDVLKSILVDESNSSTFISNNGIYGLGILRGKIAGNYKPKFIGVNARKQFREEKIRELTAELNDLSHDKNLLVDEMNAILEKQEKIVEEGKNFPSEEELNNSKNILSEAKQRLNKSIEDLESAKIELEKVKKELIEIKEKCYHACEKIFIEPKNYETFAEAIQTAQIYSLSLRDLINEHVLYLNFNKNLNDKTVDKSDIEYDISELICEIAGIEQAVKELTFNIDNINETLKSTEIANIKDEINQCIKKLDELPGIILNCSNNISSLKTSIDHINDDLTRLSNRKQEVNQRLQWAQSSFKNEYKLGFVFEYFEEDDVISVAKKLIVSLEDVKINKKNSKEIEHDLQQVYYLERSILAEYKLSLEAFNDRSIINAKHLGKNLNFYELKNQIEENIETQSQIIKDKDREMFEDILANNLSKKIRAKIFHSKKWVNDMNQLMESLDTSSGLTFSLKWVGKKAENEEELSSEDLVGFLERDSRLMKQEDIEKFIKHFKSKIERASTIILDKGEIKSFHATIKEVLDYRNWFEFQLYYTKTNEKKKELTNNAFFTFSGGEKAMAMYVPLFSAVYARYGGARKDSPRIICLDEAFAGVDSKNIRDMFRLLEQLDLSFIMNSQVLWGDYDTVPKLSVIEIIRPNNSNTVSLIRYKWNGKYREMVV